MANLSTYSDEELIKIANTTDQGDDLSGYSDDVLFNIAGMQGQQQGQPIQENNKVGVLDSIFKVPAASYRNKLLGGTFTEGAVNPDKVPTFQNLALDKYYRLAQKARENELLGGLLDINIGAGKANDILGLSVSSLGLSADIATNPAALLAMLAPKIPMGGGKTLGGVIANSKAGKFVNNILNKEITMKKNPEVRGLLGHLDKPKFAQRVRADFHNSKAQARSEWNKDIDDLITKKPDERVDVKEVIDDLRSQMDQGSEIYNPKLRSNIINAARKSKNETLIDLIDNPQSSTKITLRQAQDIKNTLKKSPTIDTKLNQGKFANWQDTDFDILDAIDGVDEAMIYSFPEMTEVKLKYGNVMEKYKSVKNLFKKGRLLKNITNRFGDPELKLDVDNLLSKEMIREMRAYNTPKTAAKVGGAGVLLWGGKKIIDKIE